MKPQTKLARWFIFLLFIALFLSGIYAWQTTMHNNNGNNTQIQPFTTLSGETISLPKNTNTPVLIQFWSTSCTSCLKEMPDLIKLFNDYKQTNFKIIAIAMQYDSINSLKEYNAHYKLPFHVVYDKTGELTQAIPRWLNTNKIYGTPTTYLLAPDGSLARQYVGIVPFNEVRTILNSWVTKSEKLL